MHQKLYTPLNLEVSVLSGDQLMFQSLKCEPTEPVAGGAPTLTTSNSSNPTASPGLLISSGGSYKVPEASNNWKAEVKRIWNKPVEQLPIGIDLPRLATSIFVPSLDNAPPLATEPTPPAAPPATTTNATDAPVASEPPKEASTEPAQPAPSSEPSSEKPADPSPAPTPSTTESTPTPMDATTTPSSANGDVTMAPPAEGTTPTGEAPAAPATPAAPVEEEVDVKAREIKQTLLNMGRFVEGDEYAQKLVENFGNYVIIDGAKDRDMSREINRLVAEYLGKESRMVKVLKACNQAIIAPAVIELTLNVCAKVPFKDAGGWRMELTKNEEGLITVTHIKQQKQRSSNKEEEFTFEWHLEIIFDEGLTGLSDVFLSIPKLIFGPHVSQSTMEGIQYTFAPYLVRR